MITRAQYNWGGAIAAIVFALISLLAALNPNSNLGALATHEAWGKLILFIWAIFPPAFFDLARNIWLGLLGVIAFAFFKDLGMLK